MADQPSILVDSRPGYRVITLNRPQRLNAFTEEMHLGLRAALDDAQADLACRALLLTGAGRAFCAGQDLSDRVAGSGPPRDLAQSLENFYNPLVR
ncbi:MAG: 2-(1,2-epoxy,2-dihydrophenyl)acetyl-CoA isomerase, partial [Alphaproteobacteria bacterium]|nr:2-(1,2-epoxy,2-dihydrophenyl)acetyl-CoA isomerase [Alphaproteobacteria bacterium]